MQSLPEMTQVYKEDLEVVNVASIFCFLADTLLTK